MTPAVPGTRLGGPDQSLLGPGAVGFDRAGGRRAAGGMRPAGGDGTGALKRAGASSPSPCEQGGPVTADQRCSQPNQEPDRVKPSGLHLPRQQRHRAR